MAHAQQRYFAKAAAILDSELNAETPYESAPQRQLWCARPELALARHAPGEALSIADKLAASLSPGKVAPRVWIVRGEPLARLASAHESDRMLTGAIAPAQASLLQSP